MGTDTIPPPRADIIVRFVGNKDNFRSEIDIKIDKSIVSVIN